MKKGLLIVLLFVSANMLAQDKREFFVKNTGDTVFCDIKKINIAPKKKTFGGFKEAKNNILFKTSRGNEYNEADIDDVTGYKLKNQFFYTKKRLIRYRQDDKYGVDTIYSFFPSENGRYQKKSIQIINKNNLRFYKIADDMNSTQTYYVPMYAGAIGGAIGGGLSAGFGKNTPDAYYFEKDNSGELFEIPLKNGGIFSSNTLDGWKLLKQYLSDNAEVVKELDTYISEGRKAKKSNIEEIIFDYTGINFDDLPKRTTD
ncbi:MAG: hypothetical protein PW786_04455 [Arachidicoccus sp.]|nr:hypothetical protein [Arachidicoccus sp.]